MPDPFLKLDSGFIMRRVAPDSRKIDVGAGARGKLKATMLMAMGFDLGAVHAATKGAKRFILRDLRARKSNWLVNAARAAEQAVRADFKEWRRR